MKRYMIGLLLGFIFFLPLSAVAAATEETAETWYERGIHLEGENKYPEAIEAFTQAVKIDPRLAEAYFKRGKVSFAYDPTLCLESLSDFTRVIDLENDNADAYYERALINFYVLYNEQGRKDMEKAASLGHEGAQRWLNPPVKEEIIAPAEEAAVAAETVSDSEPVISFDFDSSVIKPSCRLVLDEIGMDMKEKLSKTTITISGHADSTGSDEYNNGLSMRRAEAVKKYITEMYQVPSELIILKAYGESKPLVPNDSEGNRALNRRAEIKGETE